MDPLNIFTNNETTEFNFNQTTEIGKEENKTTDNLNENKIEITIGHPTKANSQKKTVTISLEDEKISLPKNRRKVRKVKSSELNLTINKIGKLQSINKSLEQKIQVNSEISKTYLPPISFVDIIPSEKDNLLMNVSPKKKKKSRVPSLFIDTRKTFTEKEDDEISLKLLDDRSLLSHFQEKKTSPKSPKKGKIESLSPIHKRKKKQSGTSGSLSPDISPTEPFIWPQFDEITHSSRSQPHLNKDKITSAKNILIEVDDDLSLKSYSRTPPVEKKHPSAERSKSGIGRNRDRFKSDGKITNKKGLNLKSLSGLSSQKPFLNFEKKSPNLRVDINSLKCLSGFEAMLLDKDCRKYIKTHWKTANKPPISSEIIDQNGLKFWKEKLEEENKNEGEIPIETWFALNSSRAEKIISSIQTSAVLIAPIHERLEIIRSIFLSFLQGKATHKTVFIEKLYYSLSDFISLNTFVSVEQKLAECNNLHKLLEASHILEAAKPKELEKGKQKETHKHLKEDKKIKEAKVIGHKVLKIVLLAFGDDSDGVSKVLGALRNWEDKDGWITLLMPKFFEWSLLDIQARNVSNIVHEWAEQVTYDTHYDGNKYLPPPIDQISIPDCIRCLMFDGVILKKLIKVNNKVFYSDENSLMFDGVTLKKFIKVNGVFHIEENNEKIPFSDEEFYINFFLTLYHEENPYSESLFKNNNEEIFVYKKSSELYTLLQEKQIGRAKEIKSVIETKLSKMKKKPFLEKFNSIMKVILKDKKLPLKPKIDIIFEFLEKQEEVLPISFIIHKIIKPILIEDNTIMIDAAIVKIVLDVFKNQDLTLLFTLKQIIMPILYISNISMGEKIEIILSQFEEETALRYERIMKLMTMSCWNRGDMYFRLSFTKLHKFPAFCFVKLLQGTESFVTIDNQFSVTEVKNYGVYPRLEPEKDDDFPAVNFDRQLAFLPVAWTVKGPLEGKWIANMRILKEWKINEKVATGDEATYIKNALNDFTSINTLNKEYPQTFVGLKRNYGNTLALNREDNK